MAIGNVAKGFPDLSARSPVAVGGWVEVFKVATEKVLGIAKEMASFVVIRDAVSLGFLLEKEREERGADGLGVTP